MSQRIAGTIKWYNTTKGYGFIGCENGENVFVHFSALVEKEFHTLTKGQRVEFSIEQNPQGLRAANVVCI